MAVEYLVVQAEAEEGPFARVTAPKLQQSWETLQAALDDLGQAGWGTCTRPFTAPRENTEALASIIVRDLFSNAWPPQPMPAPSSPRLLKSWRRPSTS